MTTEQCSSIYAAIYATNHIIEDLRAIKRIMRQVVNHYGTVTDYHAMVGDKFSQYVTGNNAQRIRDEVADAIEIAKGQLKELEEVV